MGSLASLVHVKLLALPENLKNRFHYLFEIAAFILILVAIPVIFYFHKLPKEAINLIYGLMGSSFLIFHLHGQGTLKKILGSPLLCFFGTISFGIYLWHNAILGYVDARLHAPDPLKILVIFGLTLLIASASYLAIERPFIKLKFNLNFANKDAKQVHR
jgi:peptidoglycan/LPS O-acetylase OafA/YrhL